jgi:hypothetical protein
MSESFCIKLVYQISGDEVKMVIVDLNVSETPDGEYTNVYMGSLTKLVEWIEFEKDTTKSI